MYINIIDSYRIVVALCDEDLLGKTFEEGEKQLHIKESFYKGEQKDKGEVLFILDNMRKEDATFNIVGEESIITAMQAGIITGEGIMRVNEIPYALVLL